MHTIFLDGRQYSSSLALHRALSRLLSLPEYYGCNADALNDCLSERPETVSIWILSPGEGEVADALSLIAEVVRANGGSVKELRS